jgi:hypothetical protein
VNRIQKTPFNSFYSRFISSSLHLPFPKGLSSKMFSVCIVPQSIPYISVFSRRHQASHLDHDFRTPRRRSDASTMAHARTQNHSFITNHKNFRGTVQSTSQHPSRKQKAMYLPGLQHSRYAENRGPQFTLYTTPSTATNSIPPRVLSSILKSTLCIAQRCFIPTIPICRDSTPCLLPRPRPTLSPRPKRHLN